MAHELVDLTVERVAGVDQAANGRQFLIIKRADDAMADDKDTAQLADLAKQVATLTETVAKMSGDMTDDEKKKKKDEEAMAKRETDGGDIQKRFEAEIQKRDARIAALEAEAVQKRWTDAVRDLTAIQKADDLVAELCAIEKAAGKEAAEKMLGRFAALQKQADEAGLLAELGSARGGEEAPVEQRIETEVTKRMAANPQQDRAEVYAAVMHEHTRDLVGKG